MGVVPLRPITVHPTRVLPDGPADRWDRLGLTLQAWLEGTKSPRHGYFPVGFHTSLHETSLRIPQDSRVRVLLRSNATPGPSHGNVCLAAEKSLCIAPNAASVPDLGSAWTRSHRRKTPHLPQGHPKHPIPTPHPPGCWSRKYAWYVFLKVGWGVTGEGMS